MRRAVRLIPVAVVLVVLAAIYGIASLTRPAAAGGPTASATPAITRSAAITSAARACAPIAAKQGTSGNIAMIAAPASGASGTGTGGTTGKAALTPLTAAASSAASSAPTSSGQAAPLVSASRVGLPSLTAVSGAVEIDASGSMAQGLEAEESASGGADEVRCSGPSPDIWFVGPGQQAGVAYVQLYLMNTDSQPATVDVSVITDSGVV